MLYNIEKKKTRTMLDCGSCPHFNKGTFRCEGLNKCCFEYDPKTKTIIDGITKLPIKVGEE